MKMNGNGKAKVYDSTQIVDLAFLRSSNSIDHYDIERENARLIRLCLAVMDYSTRLYGRDGIPPLALSGPFESAKNTVRAVKELTAVIIKYARLKSPVLPIPEGFTLDKIGINPEDLASIDLQKWLVEQIARIYSLPPVLLQDMTKTTYANLEQSDIHLIKHTLHPHLVNIEQELDLKLFGFGRRDGRYVKHSLAGLMRGDYKTRMQGHSAAIGTGQLTPNEARSFEEREPLEGGDELYIQGAMVPLRLAMQGINYGHDAESTETITDSEEEDNE